MFISLVRSFVVLALFASQSPVLAQSFFDGSQQKEIVSNFMKEGYTQHQADEIYKLSGYYSLYLLCAQTPKSTEKVDKIITSVANETDIPIAKLKKQVSSLGEVMARNLKKEKDEERICARIKSQGILE